MGVQVLGHFASTLDPLNLDKRNPPAELDPAYWGFKESDLDREWVPDLGERDTCTWLGAEGELGQGQGQGVVPA